MTTSGPGPDGPGPDASQDLETARRRLYGPGAPSAVDVEQYERLAAIASGPPPAPQPPVLAERRPEISAEHSPAPVRRRRRAALIAGAVGALLLVLVAVVSTRPSLPRQVAVPALAGTTLLAYGRMLDPATRPGSVTYQPEGYTVFQPRGRTVAVALRCVGEGTVRISAGPRFDFRCTDQERSVVQRDVGPRSDPFIVMGTTVGDVVWSARIVLIDPPQTAGAVPGFQDSCASCSVIGT